MKKIIVILCTLIAFGAHAQTAPLYVPNNGDSVLVAAKIAGVYRSVYGIDLFKSRASVASLNNYLRLSDSSNMLNPYLRANVATVTYAPKINPIFTGTVKIGSDTVATKADVRAGGGGGSVDLIVDNTLTGNGTDASPLGAAVLLPTAIKTSAYTAAAYDFVKTDATSASVPITLPTAPPDKTRIGIKMISVGVGFVTTYTTGGSDVLNKAGGGTSGTLTLLNQAVTLQYEAATGIWSVISSDMPLGQLDARYPTQAQLATTNANVTANATSLTTKVDKTVANTYTAGAKQTFAADATNAGVGYGGVSADPSTTVSGDFWYRADLFKFRYYDGATIRNLVSEQLAQTLTNKTIDGASNTITNVAKTLLATNMGSATVAINTTTYEAPSISTNNASESARQLIMPEAGTFKNFYVNLSVGQTGNGALTFTFRKNGVNTALQIVIPSGSAGGVYSDVTHSFTVAAGDKVSISVTNASTDAVSGTITGLSAMFYQ